MTDRRLDVLAIGNAIVDVIADADDGFIAAHGMAKGAMQLIDEEQAVALYDAMGPEFTLLRFDRSIDVSTLERAAREKGVPLVLVDLDTPDKESGYGGKLVLSRPDQHVAWRGDRLPPDPHQLIDRVRGAG